MSRLGRSQSFRPIVKSSLPAGSGSHNYQQILSGTLSLVGSIPSRAIGQVLSAALTLTGSTPGKAITRGINAGLTFAGTVAKATARILPPGALAFAGSLSRQGGKTLSGALQLTGSGPIKAVSRGLSGALTVSGSQAKQTRRTISGVLSFAGSTPSRAITRAQTAGLTFSGSTPGKAVTRGFNAAVTFTGSQQKAVRRILTAASLAFSGALASVKNGGSTAYQQTLTAGLSLAGTLQRGTDRGYQAATTFTGTQAKAVGRKLSGALSFAGSIPSRAITRTQTAALTFTGSPPAKAISQILNGSISFSGAISTVKNGGSHAYQQTLTAGLTLAAAIQRSTTRGFNAGLTFSGTQAKAITRKLSATLSSSGTLAASRLHTMILTAGLVFAGSLPGRAIGKAFSASTTFTGSQRKAITRPFAAVLTPVGQISKGIARSLFGGFSLSGLLSSVKNLIVHKPGVCTVSIAPTYSTALSVAPTYGATLTLAPTYTCTVSIDN